MKKKKFKSLTLNKKIVVSLILKN